MKSEETKRTKEQIEKAYEMYECSCTHSAVCEATGLSREDAERVSEAQLAGVRLEQLMIELFDRVTTCPGCGADETQQDIYGVMSCDVCGCEWSARIHGSTVDIHVWRSREKGSEGERA